MKNINQIKLGIDIGKVIISGVNDSQDTSFLRGDIDSALQTLPIPESFESIKLLVHYFNGKVVLVSKASLPIQHRTVLWLNHHNFFEKTGINVNNIYFCLQRQDKVKICSDLTITHFIDDRMAVLEHLKGVVDVRMLFGPQKPRFKCPKGVIHVDNWKEAMRYFNLKNWNEKHINNSLTKKP